MAQLGDVCNWVNNCQNLNQLHQIKSLIKERQHFLKYSHLSETFVNDVWFPKVAQHLKENFQRFVFCSETNSDLANEMKIVYFNVIPKDDRWTEKGFDIKIPCTVPSDLPIGICMWESIVSSEDFEVGTSKRILLLDYNVRICNRCWDDPRYGQPSLEMEEKCIDFLKWVERFKIWELQHKIEFDDSEDESE